MKLAGQPKIELQLDNNNLVIPINKHDLDVLQRLLYDLGTIDLQKEYDISITPKKKKRSMDANAYLWVLIGKLASKYKIPKNEVYRTYIKSCGVYQIIPIVDYAIERFMDIWSSKGFGWICEDMGECRNTKGYHNIICYYGSSSYYTDEMSRLIDAVVSDCKDAGIETMTPNELEELKQKWGVG